MASSLGEDPGWQVHDHHCTCGDVLTRFMCIILATISGSLPSNVGFRPAGGR
jgi:hypothetical protein